METFPGKLSNEGLTHRFTGHSQGLPFQEEIAHFNGTPLKCALRSANPLQSSPWTVEFLNRIKEKSRIRQQVSCDTSAASFGYSGNISKMTKRRSPPIIELFKYQGGRTPGKIPEKKRQQQPINSSNSTKKGKCSASLLPSCTPNDKKARKTLTFAMNESGTQTKLVWSDRTHMT
ncbi:putative Shortage in chiasmata 1 [Quillaja saponaria]|uniref:Shortage in chiasmata 1 n=1 Tax=Quillaja saponaria TaxID=32244 RepID=A0AAD7Q3J5_QUISA|nr:putative Shortage in chiasmata 1 [Quillaja saponaria]